MIDIENIVMDGVYEAVIAAFPQCSVYGEKTNSPASFPCVTLDETTNSTYTRSLDSSGKENHASVRYTVNIYSAKAKGRKAEAKAILKVVDDYFMDIGFIRTMNESTPSTDYSVYRITAQYRATIADGVTSGTDTIYYVHRI